MCITSNKPISTWPEMLAGDEVLTGAILDRLLHASTVLSIKGRSYRLRDLEEALNAARTVLRTRVGGGSLAAIFAAGKEPVLSAERDAAQRTFAAVVVDLQGGRPR